MTTPNQVPALVHCEMAFSIQDEVALRAAAHKVALDVVGDQQASGYLDGDQSIADCVHMLAVPDNVPGASLDWSQSQPIVLPEALPAQASFLQLNGKLVKCEYDDCNGNGDRLPAVRLMPQSTDGGDHIRWIACCENHVSGWWSEPDEFQAEDLEIPMATTVA